VLVPLRLAYLAVLQVFGWLARRIRAKQDQALSDRDLLADPGLLKRLYDRYDQVAADNPPVFGSRSQRCDHQG